MIVGALLGLLALLGFFFYTFARQENANAEYFAGAAKEFTDPGINPCTFFDWALEQVIIGAPPHLQHSALWGGRHALIPNMFGRDLHPYSGRGVHLINDGTGLPLVDQNYDNLRDTAYDGVQDAYLGPDGQPGIALVDDDGDTTVDEADEVGAPGSDDYRFLHVNDSPAAWSLFTPYNGDGTTFPAFPSPDVDYTAPDINNMFLGYRGTSVDSAGNPQLAVIPSYLKPQYLRRWEDINNNGILDPGEDLDGDLTLDTTALPAIDWFVNPAYGTKLLRPHPAHLNIPFGGPDGRPGAAGVDDDGDTLVDNASEYGWPATDDDGASNGVRRFLIAAADDPFGQYPAEVAADAPIIAALPGGSGGFPFVPRDSLGALTAGQLGIWSTGNPATAYELDADPDNDGINEAIWLDLDFPLQELPDGSAKYIPLFAITIYDADGLFNMNTHGNNEGDINLATPADPFGGLNAAMQNEFISRSNQGLSPSEVNPQWALTADPTGAPTTDFEQHQPMFDPANQRFDISIPVGTIDLTSWRELSNMEWFMAQVGRLDFSSSGTATGDVFPGRWGETARLQAGFISRDPLDFPFAGTSDADDNGNRLLGELSGTDPLRTDSRRPFIHPLDFRGLGRSFDTETALGKSPLFYTLPDTANRWLQYQGFETRGSFVYRVAAARGSVLWGQSSASAMGIPLADNTGNLMLTLSGLPVLPDNWSDVLFDEAFETGGAGDNVFAASENAFLQLPTTDVDNAQITSRLGDLMPYNLRTFDGAMGATQRAEQIRRKLTTVSNDVKAFGKPSVSDLATGVAPSVLQPWEYDTFDDDGDGLDDFGPGPDGKPGFADVDDDGVNGVDDPGELGWVGSDDVELLRFPPSFQTRFIADATPGTFAAEPFRPQLRRWLQMVLNQTQATPATLRQRLMSINQLVEHYAVTDPPGVRDAVWPFGDDGLPGFAGVDDDGDGFIDFLDPPANTILDLKELGATGSDDLLPLRNLTEHPTPVGNLGLGAIGLPTQPHPGPGAAFSSIQEQEAWARYDRQLLARDIYVMLYTFGGSGIDDSPTPLNLDYRASNANEELYSDAQLREMAQFAINVVNALDRDDVIDAFEYDLNLHDGWNSDDNPYDQSGAELGPNGVAGDVGDDDGDGNADLLPSGAIDTKEIGFGDDAVAVVYGVEGQYLTLSEALFIHSVPDQDLMEREDLAVTQHNDSIDRYFAFIELRNASPFPLSFNNGNSAIMSDNGVWQIELLVSGTNVRRRLTLRADDSAIIQGGGLYSIMTDDLADLDPMGMSLLPSQFAVDQDYTMGGMADFTDSPFDIIAPYSTAGPSVDLIVDWVDDMGMTNPNLPFTVVDPDAGPLPHAVMPQGTFFDITVAPVLSAVPSIELSLRRRANLGRAVPNAFSENDAYDADNPWIEVDRMELTLGNGLVSWTFPDWLTNSANFAPLDLDTPQPVPPDPQDPDGPYAKRALVELAVDPMSPFKGLRSAERREPLNRNHQEESTSTLDTPPIGGWDYTIVAPDDVRLNSVGTHNENSLANAPFKVWQPHFDRDFASVAELLAIPMFAPSDLTDGLPLNNQVDLSDLHAGLDPAGMNSAGRRKFLQQDELRLVLVPGTTIGILDQFDNRWHRLLGLVEVPTLLDPGDNYRQPGHINLNTVRDPEIIAGLIDEPKLYELDVTTDYRTLPSPSSLSVPPEHEAARDWWVQFLQARDGIDVVDPMNPGVIERDPDPVTNSFLPGLPGAQPFRAFSFLADGTATAGVMPNPYPLTSLEHTLLRGLPLDIQHLYDPPPIGLDNSERPSRRLFELGTDDDRYDAIGSAEAVGSNDGTQDRVDFFTRNRLLSKIIGNTTNRSNVFFVFIQVHYFEAVEDYGADGQPGDAGMDDDGNGTIDDAGEFNWPGSDDAVRIGGKMADSPGHRGFYVLDRSLALEHLKAADFRPTTSPTRFTLKNTSAGGFDYRSIILYGKCPLN